MMLDAPCRGADDGSEQQGFVPHLGELAIAYDFSICNLFQKSQDIPQALCILKSTDIEHRLGQRMHDGWKHWVTMILSDHERVHTGRTSPSLSV